MAQFGRNTFPRRFGGGKSYQHQEHLALLDALSPGWSDADDTESYVDLLADALAVSAVWLLGDRARNALYPQSMTETLRTWEEAAGLHPHANDTVVERRRRVAAKLRGAAGNTLTDIDSVCSSLAGPAYVEIRGPTAANEIVYWPGVNPGPPGLEWSTNRLALAVVLTKTGLNDSQWNDLRARLAAALDGLLPAWMRFVIGTEGGFVVGVSVVGETFL